MELQKMYEGIAFSPPSILTQTLGETDNIIYVANPEYFPDGPNVATIGTDADAETIYYASKTENALSGCTRGVEGEAKAWQSGEIIGRNYTADDYHRIIENILKLKNELEKQVEILSGEDAKLLDKINDCLQYRGVITSISQIDKDGYYYVNLGDSTFPYPYGILKIVSGGGEKVATYDTTGNDKKTYKNVKTSGATWSEWQQIATTTKISFLCTATSGYKIDSQDCYKINDTSYIRLTISKADGGTFNVGNHITVATLPFFSGNISLSFAGASGGFWSSIGSAMISGAYLVATINTSNTTQIAISGVI